MDAHHQATHRILQGISALGIESLSVKGLMKNRKLSKALADASLGGFLVKLKYKAVLAWHSHRGGRQILALYQAMQFLWIREKESVLIRTSLPLRCLRFSSPDRDVNAAINLKQLASSTDESPKTPLERL